MTVTTTYPGVYLSEDAVSGFSVNSVATAVPLFAYDSKSAVTTNKPVLVFATGQNLPPSTLSL